MMATAQDFLSKRGKWACNECGACCKSVWPLVQSGKFPHQWMNKKGGCKNQMKSGRCRIYENRPPICRVDRTQSDLAIAEMCATMKNHQDEKRAL